MVPTNERETSTDESSFHLIPQLIDKYETRCWRVNQSNLYQPAGLTMPKLPVYHPYHPFRSVANDDELLQIPLAMQLKGVEDLGAIPRPLLDLLPDINVPAIPFFLVQTLPYKNGTEVIARYQYALFPNAESSMQGFQSIWAQGILFDEKDNNTIQLPVTSIKIYESNKDEVSPTILCGDTMKLGLVEDWRGKGLWSLVVGSTSDDLNDTSLFSIISHAFIGYTYFIEDEDRYNEFLVFIRDKSPSDILSRIPNLIHKGTNEFIRELT